MHYHYHHYCTIIIIISSMDHQYTRCINTEIHNFLELIVITIYIRHVRFSIEYLSSIVASMWFYGVHSDS